MEMFYHVEKMNNSVFSTLIICTLIVNLQTLQEEVRCYKGEFQYHEATVKLWVSAAPCITFEAIYIYKTEMSVCLSVCLSVTFGRVGGWHGAVAEEDGQEGWGQWGGGISMMECQGGHTFPEQRRVTQLVYL